MDSLSLLTAQITFLDTPLVLVHIPIEHYVLYLSPILRLIFGEDHDEDASKIPWTNRHEFFNLSITELECSIMCSRHLAQKYIIPLQEALMTMFKAKNSAQTAAIIYHEPYIVIQVDGQGMDAGKRVLDLTGPLAMAGISVFFITTYFCDYILVPEKARQTVTFALEQRGFVFSKENDAFISQLSPALHDSHSRHESSSDEPQIPSNRNSVHNLPTTPPAQDLDELQVRTFRKLKRHNINPHADETLRLITCAGSLEPDVDGNERLKNDLLQVLLTGPKASLRSSKPLIDKEVDQAEPVELDAAPAFLSVTITGSEPISILLEERLLARLGQSLYGAKGADDVLIPIVFNLQALSFETTGIVGGVAGRLSAGQGRHGSYVSGGDLRPTAAPVDKLSSTTEISFLSTTRAGTVIVKASQLERALEVLNQALAESR